SSPTPAGLSGSSQELPARLTLSGSDAGSSCDRKYVGRRRRCNAAARVRQRARRSWPAAVVPSARKTIESWLMPSIRSEKKEGMRHRAAVPFRGTSRRGRRDGPHQLGRSGWHRDGRPGAIRPVRRVSRVLAVAIVDVVVENGKNNAADRWGETWNES